ncbi:MAG TPA: glycosyltransferase, partial [Pirellulales bacterium]
MELLAEEPWIVIAAYNEERRLGAVLDELAKKYQNIVVVDDGSRDRTAEVAKSRPVWLLRHMVNRGQGAS